MLFKIGRGLCFHPTSFLQQCAVKRKMSLLQSKKVVAVCQMNAKSDKEANIKTCAELIKTAKELRAEMVFLPEACDFIGENKKQFVENGEDLNGDMVCRFREMAREHQVWLSLGGILEKVDGNKVRNAHVVINHEGDVVSVYRKIHMFDVDIPEKKLRIMESDYCLAGNKIVPPVETPVGNVGLAICYDMRFPELSLTLAKMGADILTYPAAFTFATGASHWETILRARAIESQCYVVAAAQTGSHNSKRTSWGHAMVVDPWGSVIAQCSEGTNVAIAQIDLQYVKQVRTTMPVWQHRRNDLYAEMSPLKCIEGSSEVDATEKFSFGKGTVNGSSVFYKTSKTLAFTNIRCVVPGHVLVMPIRLVQTLAELDNAEVEDMMTVLARVRDVVQTAYGAVGTSTAIQTGADAGQTVQHLHVHILPVRPGEDIMKVDASLSRPLRTPEEMAEEASMLRSYFKINY